jgi:ligand-binding sensor domain-containing protein
MTNFVNSLKSNPGRTITFAVLFASVVILGVFLYFARINTQIESEREALEASARVEVEVSPLRAPSTDGYTVYLNAARIRAVADFKGIQYLATSGGLIALDDEGGVARRYTSLDGLPENDLTALEVFRDRLFIGTSTAGLIAFDGSGFTAFRLTRPKAARVTVLVATDSELLIGTFDGGLLQYDGDAFSRRVNAAAGTDLKHITALLPIDSRLYIGTQDRGLYIWREAHIENVGTSEGLPSPHVTGLAPLPDKLSKAGTIGVATDFGVVGLDDTNTIQNISRRPNITSLAVSSGQLWAGLFGGGVTELVDEQAVTSDSPSSADTPFHVAVGLPRSATRVHAGGDRLWALTDNGAFARDEGSSRPGFEPIAEALVSDRVLTGDHITSLSFDGGGRLWVAYFDRGIDVISTDTSERLSHIEDERVREVNFIRFDSRDDRVLVATSRGLVAFDARMKQSLFTREKSGIVDDAIAHVSVADISSAGTNARGTSILLATAGGLSEIAGGRTRSITAFHGLASNHLYTLAVAGSRLFTGSLAGLVELDGLRVVRTYKTSNSGLSHDWVTALVQADGTLYIGTNGGGVDSLLPTGEWVGLSDEVGRFEVNQNAMHIDAERVCVGTADKGLLIYNTRARRWTRISAGFPSQNVTAVASDERYLYAGTLNGLVRVEKRVIE